MRVALVRRPILARHFLPFPRVESREVRPGPRIDGYRLIRTGR